MYQGISLTQAPPLAVVFGFFLNAQVYLCLAGILGLVELTSLDFNPQRIYLIHCFSIGFLALVMFGAISQMLPVLAGVRLQSPKITAFLALLCLNIGLVAFIVAFKWNLATFAVALAFLLLGVLIFASSVALKLRFIEHFTPTIVYMCAALFSLLLTTMLGVVMLGGYALWWEIPYRLTRFHFSLGGLGWIALLIVGVSLQVLPMFYVAPPFPKAFYALLVPLLLLGFLLCLALDFVNLALLFSGAFCVSFGALGLWTLNKRKRKIKEVSITFWHIGLGAFALSGVLLWGAIGLESLVSVSIGVFVGGVMAIVYAMMYKIVPFLAWFHLSYAGVLELPNMRKIIPQRILKAHLLLFIIGFVCALLWKFSVLAGVFCALCVFLSLLAAFAILKAYFIYAHTFKTAPKMDWSKS